MAGQRLTVLGDGGWGTTLAILLLRKGHQVTLWSAFPKDLAETAKLRENRKFLPGVQLPPELAFDADPGRAAAGAEWVVVAIPSQHLRTTLSRFPAGAMASKRLISVIKGIETETLKRPTEVIQELTKADDVGVLAGPNVAGEVVRGDPTLAVAAARTLAGAEAVRDVFTTERFRIYTSTDPIGVELGGVLKNVMAIAAGIADGLGYGANAKAALVTRALVEMTHLGEALGGHRETLFGLSGLGDLVTTCFNQQSRNRRAGEAFGKGHSVQEIIATMGGVIEGIPSTKAIYQLAARHHVEMPIVTEVYRVIYEGKDPKRALYDLMSRPVGTEING